MRFFFAVVKANGLTIEDNDGVECPTAVDAVGLGRSMARDLAAEDQQYIGGAVLVRDDKGRQVELVAIRQRDAIEFGEKDL